MSITSSESLRGRLLDGRYLIEERIARGGMATVYTATDTRLDRLVAVKIMHTGLGDDEHDFSLRFVREARAAARLNHPNVVAVFDQGDDDGTVFLAMEYVPGQTLRDLMRSQGPLPPRRALAIMEQLLMALGAAHAAGIIHRDVKPENVLIAPDGRIKVADFGLARAVTTATNATTAGSGVLIGTVSYLAPEIVLNEHADARSDVYSAGVVLYELLTGMKPHSGETPIQVAYAHVHEDVPMPSATVGGIPPYLDALVARATSRDRDLRPADAQVLLRHARRVRTALDEELQDEPELTADLMPPIPLVEPTAPEPDPVLPPAPAGLAESTVVVGTPILDAAPDQPVLPPPRKARRRRRRRGPLLLAVVLVLAALAGVGGWWLGVGRYTTTPDVVGLTEAEATDALSEAGLSLSVDQQAYSETIPEGMIISTDPDAGERIVQDSSVSVVVSLGRERYEVPKLVGLSLGQARDRLESTNLELGEITRRYSESVPQDNVIAQGTEPATSVRPQTQIDLVVSKGPQPIPITDFTGQPADEAVEELEAAGFEVVTTEVFNDEVEAGLVISQNPSDGTGFADDQIELEVSRGPRLVEVPSVISQTVQSATEELEAAGFVVRTEEAEDFIGFGLVVGQGPVDGGELARYGSTIWIYYV